MAGSSGVPPQLPPGFQFHHMIKFGPSTPTHVNVITTAAALHLGHLLRHRLNHQLHRSFKRLSHLGHVAGLNDLWRDRVLQLRGINFLNFPDDNALSAKFSSCLCFLSGKENRRDYGDKNMSSYSETSRKNSFSKRRWTNILLAVNVLVYIAQIASKGKLMLWGAKINSLIDKGQLWRLVTSSCLHTDIGHLMVNCYSLNSVGPVMEKISGPRRYLAVYFSSAIASAAMSYWYCKAPSVGASGAIFGLVGSLAVYVSRHRSMMDGGGKDQLQHIAKVIMLNMAIGLVFKGIDNWGHLGGLFGGAAISCFLGPALNFESLSDGRRVLIDRAPIFYLTAGGAVEYEKTMKAYNKSQAGGAVEYEKTMKAYNKSQAGGVVEYEKTMKAYNKSQADGAKEDEAESVKSEPKVNDEDDD